MSSGEEEFQLPSRSAGTLVRLDLHIHPDDDFGGEHGRGLVTARFWESHPELISISYEGYEYFLPRDDLQRALTVSGDVQTPEAMISGLWAAGFTPADATATWVRVAFRDPSMVPGMVRIAGDDLKYFLDAVETALQRAIVRSLNVPGIG